MVASVVSEQLYTVGIMRWWFRQCERTAKLYSLYWQRL